MAEDRVLAEIKRVENLLVDHQQEMLRIKNDVFKSMLTLVMGAGGLAVGITRLAMPPAARSPQEHPTVGAASGAVGTVALDSSNHKIASGVEISNVSYTSVLKENLET